MEDCCLGFKVGVLTEKVENLEIENSVTVRELDELRAEVQALGDQVDDLETRVAVLEVTSVTSS